MNSKIAITRSPFTMIELLICLMIIGALAAFSVPLIGHNRNKANGTKCADQIRQIEVCKAAFLLENSNVGPTASAQSRRADIFLHLDKGEVFCPSNASAYDLQTFDAVTTCPNNGVADFDPDKIIGGGGSLTANGYHDIGRAVAVAPPPAGG